MHALMARADAQAAAAESGYDDAQRAALRERMAANVAAGRAATDGLDAADARVAALGDSAHYLTEAASARSRRAHEMRDEFDRVFWGAPA